MKLFSIAYISLLFLKITFMPNLNLLMWVAVAVAIDLVTGVAKSAFHNIKPTSGGFKRTIVKALQYAGLIVAGIVIGNTTKESNELVQWINDGMLLFLIYIEVYSIIENLRDLNPESKIAKMIFVPLLSILTFGIDKLSLLKKTDKPNDALEKNTILIIAVISATALLSSCTVVKPGNDTSYTKTDSTQVVYKPIIVPVKGATVYNHIDYDSLYKAWLKTIPENQKVNIDSLFNEFKKSLKKDTVRTTDPFTKAELKYWFDEHGKLQIQCTAKDRELQLMQAEIIKLTTEKSKQTTTVVQYKMTWWGWICVGWALILTVLVIAAIIYRAKI